MSKSRKQTVENEMKIDPEFKKEALEQMNRAKLVASMRPALNFAPQVAAFTPQQRASMQSASDMASAFGIQSASPQFGTPQEVGNTGMYGYSPKPIFDEAVQGLPEGYSDKMQEFFDGLRRAAQEGQGPGPNQMPGAQDPTGRVRYDSFSDMFDDLGKRAKRGDSVWSYLYT